MPYYVLVWIAITIILLFFSYMKAKRKDLPPMGVKLAKKAKEQKDRWVIPVIWKFCDLDHSHDYKITAQEQVTITAPLKVS